MDYGSITWIVEGVTTRGLGYFIHGVLNFIPPLCVGAYVEYYANFKIN